MTATTTISVDYPAMLRVLTRVESDAHRFGWDKPPALHVLYDTRDRDTDQVYRNVIAGRRGPAVRVAPYAAQSMVAPRAFTGNPVHSLFRFALNMAMGPQQHTRKGILAVLSQPGFLGFAFTSEGWVLHGQTMAEIDAHQASGRAIADTVGGQEQRTVGAVDLTGAVYMVCRIRGEKPLALCDRLTKDFVGDGTVIECLQVLTAVVAGLPVPEGVLTCEPRGWSWDEQQIIEDDNGATS